jgi:hypothetical protein
MHFHMPNGNCALVRAVLACCMATTATFALAAGPLPLPPNSTMVTGLALEVEYAGSYTYLRLRTRHGETWAAVLRVPVWQGDIVTIDNAFVMHNFESKPLNRIFRTILLGTLDGTGAHAIGTRAGAAHALRIKVRLSGDVHVAKAVGRNALTVAEVNSRRAQFMDRVVQVRGRVVKFNPNIMGMNWVHLRDGSGSALEGNNDILVTTEQEVAIGEDVTAVGIVRTDVDFGSGYSYQVLIDDATFK